VFELLLRIGFSLIVVFVLMWGIAKVVRRPLAGRNGDLLAVVARQQMTRGASVAVVRVADRALIVGVTDNQVTLLGETTIEALEAPQQAAPARRSPIQLVADAPPALAEAEVITELPARPALPRQAAPAQAGRLTGSLLSPATWAQTIEFLRERTVRK
jgi:flagellar protein FliO/FliZ